jgi:hypothetical protein
MAMSQPKGSSCDLFEPPRCPNAITRRDVRRPKVTVTGVVKNSVRTALWLLVDVTGKDGKVRRGASQAEGRAASAPETRLRTSGLAHQSSP